MNLANQLSLIEENYYSILRIMGDQAYIQIFRQISTNFYEYCKQIKSDHHSLDTNFYSKVECIFDKYIYYFVKKRDLIAEIKFPIISSFIVLIISIILLLLVDYQTSYFWSILLIILILWSFIEIMHTIKFSLEFNIINKSNIKILNKIFNLFIWKNTRLHNTCMKRIFAALSFVGFKVSLYIFLV